MRRGGVARRRNLSLKFWPTAVGVGHRSSRGCGKGWWCVYQRLQHSLCLAYSPHKSCDSPSGRPSRLTHTSAPARASSLTCPHELPLACAATVPQAPRHSHPLVLCPRRTRPAGTNTSARLHHTHQRHAPPFVTPRGTRCRTGVARPWRRQPTVERLRQNSATGRPL